MTKSYHFRGRIPMPCGHSTPHAFMKCFVKLKEGFDAQLIHCSKCGTDYYAPFNISCLPEALQNELDQYGVVSVADIYRFLLE